MAPAGPPIALPDGSGVLVFGRSARATLFFDDPDLSARHCELAFEDGLWRVRDLGSQAGTFLNEHPLEGPRALFAGDVVRFGGVRLRFETDLPGDDPRLLQAIERDPDAPGPWLVYADQLEELGDPLAQRMARARAGARLDHQPWLGPLWDHLVSGALEVDWHLGFARAATLRAVAGRLPLEWRPAVAALFNARVGRLLRELTVDLPRLEQRTPGDEPAMVERAQRWLALQPALPSTLGTLRLGYQLGGSSGAAPRALPELVARAPRLAGAVVFGWAAAGVLRLLSTADGVRVSGLVDGARLLAGVVRVRRGSRTQLHLEAPPGMPFLAEGNPCYLTTHQGGVRLVTGRMRGELRVNGRADALHDLLPGDLLEIQGGARFRFELAAAGAAPGPQPGRVP